MRKSRLIAWAVVLASFLTAGCGTRVRTYIVDKERVDQDLKEGNAGYLAGAPDPADLERPRKLTRQTYVAEVELPDLGRSAGRRMLVEETSHEGEQDLIRESEKPSAGGAAQALSPSTYTVQNNDTLTKISLKVYGTTAKWKRIFEANADQLKSPDRIYAGQVLKIPQD